ncbi:MAG: hypothetical protein ACYTEN_10800, partial [Planctomycetota bacterium]
ETSILKSGACWCAATVQLETKHADPDGPQNCRLNGVRYRENGDRRLRADPDNRLYCGWLQIPMRICGTAEHYYSMLNQFKLLKLTEGPFES